jgi:hypothetical protein
VLPAVTSAAVAAAAVAAVVIEDCRCRPHRPAPLISFDQRRLPGAAFLFRYGCFAPAAPAAAAKSPALITTNLDGVM